MASAPTYLSLEPRDELKFVGPYDRASMATLRMTNEHPERAVHFKLKTTVPKRYFVRPNAGIIGPNASTEASIILQPSAEDDEDAKSKHKFMIQYIVEPERCEMTSEELWKETSLIQRHKLKCTFDSEEKQQQSETVVDSVAADDVKHIIVQEVQKLRDEITMLRRDHALLKNDVAKCNRTLEGGVGHELRVFYVVVLSMIIGAISYAVFRHL